MMNAFCSAIEAQVLKNGEGPLLIHSDVLRARAAIMPISDPKAMLSQHIESLSRIAATRELLFPSFNYDFLKTRTYNPQEAPSQIGPLTEFARTNWATWRAGPPVFNIVGKGKIPDDIQEYGELNPFGDKSVFASLDRCGGDIILYGATLASMTAIHYIEHLSGGPFYRYDKVFSGFFENRTELKEVDLVYPCRPMNKGLDYDFPRLTIDAEKAGVITKISGPGSQAWFVRLSELRVFWLEKLKDDPLYLLSDTSRAWVAPTLDRLGRRFQLNDFE